MSKYFFLTILSFYPCMKLGAQDVINPYINYQGSVMPSYHVQTGSNFYEFNAIVTGESQTTYNGEYLIQFNLLWWFRNYPNVAYFKQDYLKTYKVEVVGYPFVMNCAYTTGCADGSTTLRALEMPEFPLINEQWGNHVWRKRENLVPNPASSLGEQSGIISHFFHFTSPITGGQPYYPHSVHRFTVYIHDGNSITDPKMDSISFLYDHTRGRMRYYPFIQSNTLTGMSTDWDITFRPRLVYKDFTPGHSYVETSNAEIYDRGNTINYFPFGTYSNPLFSDIGDNFFYKTASTAAFKYIHPAPYCLTSFLPYTGAAYDILAGYDKVPNSNAIIAKQGGIKHTYFIQRNMDLSQLNPWEKIIYNPSEVTLTSAANNIVFPSGYKFQTIRGRYPTQGEVLADNTATNGGPYTDPRKVPVRTDLRSENPVDPNDPAVAKHSVFASRYYLESGSRITVEPCVGLFDAAFDVKQGATLWFQDKPSTWGVEDTSNRLGRYKIRGLGGAVLRNGATTQFVQNGLITQSYPLHYTAVGTIISGHHVDPDTDAPTGDYVIEPGASVSFTAGGVVILKDGFHAKQGSEFRATTGWVSNSNCPPAGLRMAQPQAAAPESSLVKPHAKLWVYPNPGNGVFTLSSPDTNLLPAGIKVINNMGKVVFETRCHDAGCLSFDLGQLPAGVYLVRVQTGRDVLSARLVKQ
jgi:hypothetical protein